MLVRPYGWFANIHSASGYDCAVTILFQQFHFCNHPVRLRLPPLQRRGMYRHCTLCRYDTTTPSGFACHPSEGGECTGTRLFADMTQPPRQASPATPPKEGNVPTLYFVQIFLQPSCQAMDWGLVGKNYNQTNNRTYRDNNAGGQR